MHPCKRPKPWAAGWVRKSTEAMPTILRTRNGDANEQFREPLRWSAYQYHPKWLLYNTVAKNGPDWSDVPTVDDAVPRRRPSRPRASGTKSSSRRTTCTWRVSAACRCSCTS